MKSMIVSAIKNILVKNIKVKKNKNHSKKALISYIVHPFFSKKKKHPNSIELECIVDVFIELGYAVTIIDYRYDKKIDFDDYSVIFGFGRSVEKAVRSVSDVKVVYYATGAPSEYQNSQAIKALIRYNEKYNVKPLESVRIAKFTDVPQLSLATGVVCVGNSFSKSLYQRYNRNVCSVPSTYFKTNVHIRSLDKIKSERNNFVWLGGTGAIHKGLDIVIEYFKSRRDLHLDIFGPLKNEKTFFGNIGSLPSNIIYHGFHSVDSSYFSDVMKKCSIVILPSCSEGQATSLITACANFNMMSLHTLECTMPESINNNLIEPNLNSVELVINRISELDDRSFLKLCNYYGNICRENNSPHNFKIKMHQALSSIINSGK